MVIVVSTVSLSHCGWVSLLHYCWCQSCCFQICCLHVHPGYNCENLHNAWLATLCCTLQRVPDWLYSSVFADAHHVAKGAFPAVVQGCRLALAYFDCNGGSGGDVLAWVGMKSFGKIRHQRRESCLVAGAVIAQSWMVGGTAA